MSDTATLTTIRVVTTNRATGRESKDTLLRPVGIALATVPFVALALLYLFAWDTSRSFGAWPTYANPDPKDANSPLYVLSGIAVLAAFPAVATLTVSTLALRRLRLTRRDVATILVGAFGVATLWFVFSGDLGNWYMD